MERKTKLPLCCSHSSVDAFDTCDSAQLEGKCSLHVEKRSLVLSCQRYVVRYMALTFTLVFHHNQSMWPCTRMRAQRWGT